MRHLVFLLSLSSVIFFTLSEIADNNFSKCKEFFLNDRPPTFTPPAGVSVQPICQCLWDEDDQQRYFYATLYSTTWKIPIYSAYVFGSANTGRRDAWYIEPQLDGEDEPCMRSKGSGKNIGKKQAVNSDYAKSGFDRGHLYPVLHTDNYLSMLATSTLTNAAPQDQCFNRVNWLEHEEAVIKDLESCNMAYVVTGVVPDKNRKIKEKVTVSKYYWRATCCLKDNQYMGKGYYGPDNNGKVQELTVKELQSMLIGFYQIQNNKIEIFPSIPPTTDEKSRKRPRTEYPCN